MLSKKLIVGFYSNKIQSLIRTIAANRNIDFFSIQYIFVNPLFYFFTFTAINPFMLHPSRLSSRIVVNFRETGSIRMPRNEHECTRFTRMMIGEEGETNERRRKKRKRGGRRKKRRLTSPRVESP